MGRVNFVEYKGKSILIEDFTNLRPGKEFVDTIDAAQKLIASQPPKSVLAVLDATNAHYDVDIIARMKDFVKANSPYIKSSAVVGVTGLLYIALNTLASAAGRKFPIFQSREEAMDYLLSQNAGK